MVNADFHAFSPLLSLRMYSSWWMDNNLQITFTNWKNITLRFLENCSSGLFKRFLENCKLRHSFGGSCEAQILRHCRIFLCNTYATFATFKHTCSDATASITSSKAHSMYVTVKYYFWIVQNLFPTTFGETYTSHKTVTFASAWNITLLLFWKHSKSKQRLDTYLILLWVFFKVRIRAHMIVPILFCSLKLFFCLEMNHLSIFCVKHIISCWSIFDWYYGL